MSSSPTYDNTASSAQPGSSHHDLQDHYDLENPLDAMTSYARLMHQHTKTQMDIAARSSRRRSPEGVNATSTLTTESSQSSRSSVDSSAS